MMYIKTDLGDRIIKVELDAEKVYTQCPTCGKELQINLWELYQAGDDEHSAVFCSRECANKTVTDDELYTSI